MNEFAVETALHAAEGKMTAWRRYEAAITRFISNVKRRYGKTSTAKHYPNDLDIFAKEMKQKAPEAITPADIDDFVDRQIMAGMTPACKPQSQVRRHVKL